VVVHQHQEMVRLEHFLAVAVALYKLVDLVGLDHSVVVVARQHRLVVALKLLLVALVVTVLF
jgi:hypothetical protein